MRNVRCRAFDDINDPASAKKIDPLSVQAAFGANYRLNAITIAITDEPVTKGRIDKTLGDEFFKNYAIKLRAAVNSLGAFGLPFAFGLTRKD